MRVAVVGAGWAGLAAAVQATRAGHAVTLFDAAAVAGGRARSLGTDDDALDNGQHILIGAYRATLGLMRAVGADPERLLLRRPLELRHADGRGLALAPGAPAWGFVRGTLGARGWSAGERAALLAWGAQQALRRFRAPAHETVAQRLHGLPARVREDLLEPLCVAALNTPAAEASARVFLRVLHDALLSGPGSADLLLPRAPLSCLLPQPAIAWLHRAQADIRLGQRARDLVADARGAGWRLDGERHDAVILACGPRESARLTATIAPAWSRCAGAVGFEPIATVYLRSAGSRLAAPMIALAAGPAAPAQFAFDLGACGGRAGRFAWVVSGARPWLSDGAAALADQVLAQATSVLPRGLWREPPTVERCIVEKRATFLCRPGLTRPPRAIGPRLLAAGDHVEGPYPSTLEGAVRAGLAAAAALASG